MTRRPTVEADPTAVVVRVGASSVRLRPDDADEFADSIKAVAAELRKSFAEAAKRKAETVNELRKSAAVKRPR